MKTGAAMPPPKRVRREEGGHEAETTEEPEKEPKEEAKEEAKEEPKEEPKQEPKEEETQNCEPAEAKVEPEHTQVCNGEI